MKTSPDKQRLFALDVVQKLRAAGYESYWAGGCVRDQLLGIAPKDYDVATIATPEQVQELFGRRRTLPIGAAFGVICVVGPKGAGQIEVATFRQDLGYTDGRRPDAVAYCSAKEDALRRDFTINGLFYDPTQEQIIDFVDGQKDLAARLVRAIGDPAHRFEEDKLRMLRAVRFASTFDFTLDPATADVIRRMASEVTVVSAERIAVEMEKMLVHPNRTVALRLLRETKLLDVVLPELTTFLETHPDRLEPTLTILSQLKPIEVEPTNGEDRSAMATAMATLLREAVDAETIARIGRRWKLTNRVINRAAWLLKHQEMIRSATSLRWSELQPILIEPGIADLLCMADAVATVEPDLQPAIAHCRERLALPPEELNPTPLLDGNDLLRLGLQPGPNLGRLLAQIRTAQLDAQISTKEEALWIVEKQ